MKYMFKAGNCSFTRNKRAIMALDALIGTVLSVIALFFLLQLMYVFFFQNNDPNLEIAKNDAQSIVDFVNTYSSDNKNNPYFDNENCFFILKLQNLENFQVQKDAKKTYSYLITDKEVLIVDNDNVKLFEENLQLNSNIVKKSYKFENQVQIKKDKTDPGLLAKVDLFFIFSVGDSGKFKIKETLNKQLIYLKQGENKAGKGFDNNNILYPFIYQENKNIVGIEKNPVDWYTSGIWGGQPKNFKLVNGGYLVFSKNWYGDRNILFATESELSNLFVKNNLCSKKQLEKLNNEGYYKKEENLLNLDYFNKKIIFSCDVEEKSIIKLIWENNYKCESEGDYCKEFLSKIEINNYNSIFKSNNPKDIKLKDFCNEKVPNYKYSFKIEESLNKKINQNQKLNFNSLFIENEINIDGKDLLQLSDKDKEKNNFVNLNAVFNPFGFGDGINGCDKLRYKSLCRDIYFKDGSTYFYVLENRNNLKFYSFNDKALRQSRNSEGKVEIYFLNKKVEYEPKEFKMYGKGIIDTINIFGPSTKLNVIELKINDLNVEGLELNKITVYLTPVQFYNIQVDNNLNSYSEVKSNDKVASFESENKIS